MVRFSGPAFVVASLVMAAAVDAQQPPASQPASAPQPAQVAQPAQPQSPPAQSAASEKDPLYVLDVRVVKSLDREHGLDRAAVDAIRAMTFEPGMLDGKPVTTLGDITTSFNLR